MKLGLGPAQKQELVITQQMVQSLNILQMDSLTLQEHLLREAMDNPVIDLDLLQSAELRARLRWLSQTAPQPKAFRSTDDEETSPPEMGAHASLTLQDDLRAQLTGIHCPEAVLLVADYLIDCVDEKGYLCEDVDETARFLHVDSEVVEDALRLLRSFSPPGVCAQDLSHCLLAQLPDTEENRIARRIIESCLEPASQGHYSQIARSLGVSAGQIREEFEKIRKLSPIPSVGYADREQTHYLEADVITLPQEGGILVELANSFQPFLQINASYLELYDQCEDAELKNYLDSKFRVAARLFSCVQQRETTLLQCAKAIAELQHDYLSGKSKSPSPMTLNMVADLLDLHPSTVSRVTQGKHLQTVHGLISFRSLFATKLGNSGDLSSEAAKKRIRELVDREDKRKPLSDQAIADRLKGEGFSLSRRAVTKYRDALAIPGTYARRKDISNA